MEKSKTTIKKQTIPRTPKRQTDEVHMVLEQYDTVKILQNTSVVSLDNGNDYREISDLMSGLTYTNYSALYSRVRIDWLEILIAPADSANYNVTLFNNPECPDFNLAFYPNINTTPGNVPNFTDSSLFVSSVTTEMQRFYISFDKDYYHASNGTGYGVWFNPLQRNNVPGVIGVFSPYNFLGSTGSITNLNNLKVRIGVTFSHKLY